MTSLLAVFGFLAAFLFLAEGQNSTEHFSCEQCLEYGSTTCSGNSTECKAPSKKCIQAYEVNKLCGDKRTTAVKTCHDPVNVKPLACEFNDHSFNNTDFFMRFVTSCGKPLPVFKDPALNTTLNGYKCPDCFKEGSSDECITTNVIECTGRQSECLTFQGQASRPQLSVKPYSFKGCATPSACDLIEILPGTRIVPNKYTCTSRTADL